MSVSPLKGIQQLTVAQFHQTEFKPIKKTETSVNVNISRDNAIYQIHYLSQKNGLPHQGVHSLDSDQHGKVYFGSGKHFDIFNGRVLTSYVLPDSIGSIQDILCYQNKVWISTLGGLYLYNDGRFFGIDYFNKIAVSMVSTDSHNALWVSTDKDYAYIITPNGDINQLKHNKIKFHVKKMYEDQAGNKWLGAKYGMVKLGKTDTLFYDFEEAGLGFPTCFREFNGELVVGVFFGGILRINGEHVQRMVCHIEENSVHDLEVFNGHLWVPVYGGGLYSIQSNGTYMRFTQREGLPSNSAHKICTDSCGNIWISDLSRLVRFSEQHFKPNLNLSSFPFIYQASHFRDTSWYFLAFGGPVRKIGNDYFQMEIPSDFGKVHYHFSGGFERPDKVWLQSYDQGMVVYENNQLIAYQHSHDDVEYQTHSPMVDKWGRVWATSYRGAIKYLKNDTVFILSETLPFLKKSRNLSRELHGDCYFTYDNFLYRIGVNHFHQLEMTATIEFVFSNKNGGIWIYEKGSLKHIVGDQIVTEYQVPELKNLDVHQGVHFANEVIYLSTSDKIYKLKLSAPHESGWYEPSYLMKGGSLILDNKQLNLSNETTLTLDENWNYSKSSRPYLHIKEIKVNGHTSKNSKTLKLTPEDNLELVLDFALQGHSSELQYTFHQSGQQDEWQKVNLNLIKLLNLSPGDYVLKIRCRNDQSDWQETKLTVIVDNYWYQNTWFYAGCIALIVFLMYMIFRARLKRANRRQAKLETIIEEKTAEIAQEKKQVEKELQDKEILLKEVNHRVKNNMQMVSSLLELQKSKTNHETDQENLTIAIKRIKALSIAHQHLYQGDEYESIELSSYLSVIVNSLKIDNTIRINQTVVKRHLFIESAQAIGLVLNELIHNSLKHAWELNTRNRIIDISIREENNMFTFTYADNGNKVNEVIKNDGLGKKIIHAIVKRQLRGSLTESFGNGYTAIIKFKSA